MNRLEEYRDIARWLMDAAKTDRGIGIILSGHEQKNISYRTLLERSGRLCRNMLRSGVRRQERILVCCDSVENLLYGFWACALAGCTAVMLNSAGKDRLEKTLADKYGFAGIVTDTEPEESGRFSRVFDLRRPEEAFGYEPDPEGMLCHDMEELLYVQFSSGTTGEGKAIPVKRRNAFFSVLDESRSFGMTDSDVILNWQPLTHSGGLVICHLLAVFMGLPQYIIPAEAYIKNPLLWAEALSRCGATFTGTIPFAMRHFLRFLENSKEGFRWDLSALRVVGVGAEHVDGELLGRFADRLAPYGLSRDALVPVYGLTEATCLLAFAFGEREAYHMERHRVDFGENAALSEGPSPYPGYIAYSDLSEHIEVRITDGGNKSLPALSVGKLWIKGPAVVDGYLSGDGSLNDGQFCEGWFDTGDIGALTDEGKLVIVGRAKEIVVSGGANFECAALEKCIDGVDSGGMAGPAVVCNILDRDGVEQAVVFCEWNGDGPDGGEPFARYRNQVRDILFEKFGITVYDVAAVKELPRSGSGKLKRGQLSLEYMRARGTERTGDGSRGAGYAGGKSRGAGQAENKAYRGGRSENKAMRTDVSGKIHEILKEIIGIEITDDTMTFQEYGVVSMNIVQLVDMCSEAFGINMKASEVFNYPVIGDFIAHTEQLVKAAENAGQRDGAEGQEGYAPRVDGGISGGGTARDEDIAIVGMSCRFPNGGNSAEEYWKLLIDGIDGITEVPEDRWDRDKYYSENKNEPGKMYCKKGGFLNIPVSDFDAKFFNISPKEAAEIDPHSRMLLELTYEAFENGGMDITEYSGSRTGVFIGAAMGDYSLASVSSGDMQSIDSYSLTGVCTSTVCGRISYTFGFQGTCLTVNTACSSALTALHTAVNSLRAGDVDAAVVGGVSLMLSPAISVAFSKLQAVSPNGHCRSFDADADGYARGEGAGVIVIKRLSGAERDHDNILGVIKATGANQDGHSNGLTAPNGEAQKSLILETLERNGLEPDSVSYVETHGTGTPLGDPIEVNALIDAYCADRPMNNPLLIGSVKSNIGHLEAASGMAAIIKILLSFRHGMIPANLNFNKPNPQIRWEGAPVRVVSSNTEWRAGKAPRRAAVDSFGFGGSNAHVIIEEYRPQGRVAAKEYAGAEALPADNAGAEACGTRSGNYFLKISAKSDTAIRRLASEYIKLLMSTNEDLEQLCMAADIGRPDYMCRAAVSGSGREELVDGLMKVVNEPSSGAKHLSGTVFLFTGQGSQYAGMAAGLYKRNPVFRKHMQKCDGLFRPYLLTSICELVYGGEGREAMINNTAYAQPLIFSVEYALAKMWISYGIEPAAVLGHSIGEYAAAVIAGCMSLETAVELVACRGRLMGAVSEDGTMAAVFAGRDAVEELLEGLSDCVIAVMNSDTNTVVSGKREQVALVTDRAKERGIRSKELVVSNAFHSPLMEQAAKDFAFIADKGQYGEARIPFISTVYARELKAGEILDGEYWRSQIMLPVNFRQSVLSVEKPENYMFLEIGAANTLSMLADMILEGRAECVPSLIRGQDDNAQIYKAAARLYIGGFSINWENFLDMSGRDWIRSSRLPSYPFERTRYWRELRYDRSSGADIAEYRVHSLLGQRLESAVMEDSVVFQRIYRWNLPFFMGEHIIFDTAIAPAAAYVSLVITAMKELRNPKSIIIQNMELREPLIVNKDETREVQICVSRAYEKECTFMVASRPAAAERAPWTVHTRGNVIVNDLEYLDTENTAAPEEWDRKGYDESASPEQEHSVYKAMEHAGFALGEGFRRLTRSRCQNGTGVCFVEPKEDIAASEDYLIYPGVVDSVFHSMLCVSLADGFSFEGKKTVIPYFITQFGFNYREFDKLWCDSYARIENNSMMGGTKAYNRRGEAVIVINQMMTKLTTEESLITSHRANHNWYYREEWKKAGAILPGECDAKRIYLVTEDADSFETDIKIWESRKKEVVVAEPGQLLQSAGNIFEEIASAGERVRILYAAGCGGEYAAGRYEEDFLRLLALMAQEIQKRGIQGLCTLRVITRNGCNFRNKSYNFSQSLLWGFMRGMCMEMPETFAGIIDLEEIGQNDGEIQLAALMLAAPEPELCVRDGEIYYSRVERLASVSESGGRPEAPLAVSAEKTYVVAGGTGALGRQYIQTLYNAGARNFAVICRKEPPAESRELFDRLEKEGARVGLFYGNICDGDSAARVMEEIKASLPPVGGIVNAAGVLRDKMIRDLEWRDYQAVLAPKTYGSMNLYQEAKDEPLDFFMLLSSITSVLGNLGQSNYAAANYFENMFSSYVHSEGHGGRVICWGPWLGSGMAVNDAVGKNMEVMGIRGFTAQQAGMALEEFIGKPYQNLIVADIDWDRFADNAGNPALKSKLSGLVKKSSAKEEQRADWDVDGMSEEEIRDELTDRLRHICMNVMGYDSVDMIDTEASLMELGADSLMMFSVRSEISNMLRIDMNVSVLYTYDTVSKLSDYLFSNFLAKPGQDSAKRAGSESGGKALKPKLFFFPYAGSSVYSFVKWKSRLQEKFDVVFVEYPGRGGRTQEPFAETIEELVGSMLDEVAAAAKEGEYFLFGHSLGAVVAYELMVQLGRRGLPMPKKAFLSGREPIRYCKISVNTDDLPDEQFMEIMSRYGGIPKEFYQDKEVRDIFLPVLRADFRLLERYLFGRHDEKADCDLAILYGEDDKNTPAEEMRGWTEYSDGDVEFYSFPGTHFYCMEEENTDRVINLILKEVAQP